MSLSKLCIILKFHMVFWSWEMQGYIECEKVTVAMGNITYADVGFFLFCEATALSHSYCCK